MVEVKFYEQIEDSLLKFAVIIARTNGKWIFCKHKERTTFELPGGHREEGETITEAAERELKEETGANAFDIRPVCVYAVKGKTRVSSRDDEQLYGMLFIADVYSFEEIHSEIEKIIICDNLIEDWTYPLIQPKLIQEAIARGCL